MDKRLYTISTCRGQHRGLLFYSVNTEGMHVFRGLLGTIYDLGSQMAGDSSRHRVAPIIGWFVVQSAAGALKEAKTKKDDSKSLNTREK